jgi:hypothetical protein
MSLIALSICLWELGTYKIRSDGLQILRAVAVFMVAWLQAGQELDKWRVRELLHFAAFGLTFSSSSAA